MKVKIHKKATYLKNKARQLDNDPMLVETAEAWADAMEDERWPNKDFGLMAYSTFFQVAYHDFSHFERAWMVQWLIWYWRKGRRLKKWYKTQNSFSKVKLA